jgi:phosphoribosylformimino-5-aminoimidazole carboxamide ribotide isomerase
VLVIPAIDLLEGQAVRLVEGDRAQVTVYSDEPSTLAATFVRAGAKRIHVVDLDGAFAGKPVQIQLLRQLLDAARAACDDQHDVELEVGGGIRDAAAVEQLIEAGVDKVVVGTLAIRQPKLVAELCRTHHDKIIVAIDARDGMVSIEGWRETSTVPAAELAMRAADWGAAGLLFTDVSRDGLQGGPAVESTAALQAQVDRAHPIDMIDVIASGGVGSLEHLDALAAAGVRAVICGRALYERSFTLEEALARC